MKIAIITAGDSNDMKGAFNATHNRIKHLMLRKEFDIDVYLIQSYDNFICRYLKHSNKRNKDSFFVYDGIKYNNLWHSFSLIDYLCKTKLKCKGPFIYLSVSQWYRVFKQYDLVSAHSYLPGILSLKINKEFKIPFSITWHGSDIHTAPFLNSSVFKLTKRIMENSFCNFFVSENLFNCSEKISIHALKKTLYNGVDRNVFKRYDDSELADICCKYNIAKCGRNIAFFGGLVSIKNPNKLPLIFYNISRKMSNVFFYIIGDGKMRSFVEQECFRLGLNVIFLGNQPPSSIPLLINCMDLILLPSKNEGLPLIALESLACGVPVIGSRVGGIPECVGVENTVELNEMFDENFSNLAVKTLQNNNRVVLRNDFDWYKIAETESKIYKSHI